MKTIVESKRRIHRRRTWAIQFAASFEQAEAQTREYWHNATPAERLNALESLREPFYGPDQASRRLQRFLELVPFLSLEDLKTNKRVCGRPKDLQDLEELP